jgi:hypothetical protein
MNAWIDARTAGGVPQSPGGQGICAALTDSVGGRAYSAWEEVRNPQQGGGPNMAVKACNECRKFQVFTVQIVQTQEGPARLEECGTCGAIVSYTLVEGS